VEKMLNLAANRGFAVFNTALPINGIVRNLWKFSRPAVDAVVNGGQVFVALNFFTLLNTEISRIAIPPPPVFFLLFYHILATSIIKSALP
jgi:hypothetical protein